MTQTHKKRPPWLERKKDAYAWLKDIYWRSVLKNPRKLHAKIRAYLEEENRNTDSFMQDTKELQRILTKEIVDRTHYSYTGIPIKDGDYYYYAKHDDHQDYPIYCRKYNTLKAKEEVTLDLNKKSTKYKFFAVSSCQYSPNRDYIAFGADKRGAENYHILIKDIKKGLLLEYKIPNTSGSYVWGNDSQTIYYVKRNAKHRPSQVYRHRLFDDVTKDELVFEESDPGFFLEVEKTESGRFILIYSNDETAWEIYFLDADNPYGKPKLIKPRKKGEVYEVSDHDEDFYILTNTDGAKDFKVMKTPIAHPSKANWQDVVPHYPGKFIRELLTFKNHLVRLELYKGLPRIVVSDLAHHTGHVIDFDRSHYDLQFHSDNDFNSNILRFSYGSFRTKKRIFAYNMDTHEPIVLRENSIKGGFNPDRYTSKRLFAPGHDGEEIPIILFYHKDTKINGKAPMLITAYGAYGHMVETLFDQSDIISLVDRGFIFAMPLVRGSKAKGYAWHEAGKRFHKKNTFKDFIACTEYLINKKYASKDKIAAYGMSAGGLIMGYIANNRPDLYKVIIADVPSMDLLNSLCDPELPLTPIEWREWGNPLESEHVYEYIKSYAPYENIKAQEYPHMLVTAGLTDPRVTYWEPAKWVARLREMQTNGNIQLLKVNMHEGHFGPSGKLTKVKESAFMMAFILKIFEMS